MRVCCRFGGEFLALLVDSVGPGVGEADFKPPEEREGEDDEQQADEDVEHGICRHGIQGVGAEEGRHEQA